MSHHKRDDVVVAAETKTPNHMTRLLGWHPWLDGTGDNHGLKFYPPTCKWLVNFVPFADVFNLFGSTWGSWSANSDIVIRERHALDFYGTLVARKATGPCEHNSNNLHNTLSDITVCWPTRRGRIPTGFMIITSHAVLPEDDNWFFGDPIGMPVAMGEAEPIVGEDDAISNVPRDPKAKHKDAYTRMREGRDPEMMAPAIFRANQKMMEGYGGGGRFAPKPKQPRSWSDTITRGDWHKLCWAMNPRDNRNTDNMTKYPPWDMRNPANPFVAYSLARACEKAALYDCDPVFSDVTSYLITIGSRDTVAVRPNKGVDTYRVDPADLHPTILCNQLFPHLPRPVIAEDSPSVVRLARELGGGEDAIRLAQERLGSTGHGTGYDNTLRGLGGRVKPQMDALDREHLDRKLSIEKKIRTRFKDELAARREEFAEDVMRRMAEFPSIPASEWEKEVKKWELENGVQDGETQILVVANEEEKERLQALTNDISARRRLLQEKFVIEFAAIKRSDGNISSALRSLSAWQEKFVRTTKDGTMRMPVPRIYKNLTSFGGRMAAMLFAFEHLFGVYNSHTQVAVAMFSMLHVYKPGCSFHPNMLCLGPYATGKSFLCSCIRDWFAPGTTDTVNSTSMKASYANNNDKSQDMIFIFEEAPLTMLGLDAGKADASGSARGSGVTSAASAFRDILTRLHLRHRRLVMNPATGQWETEEIDIELNSIFLMAMNAVMADIPKPTLSRFVAFTYNMGGRDDMTNLSKLVAKLTVTDEPEKKRWIDMIRRDQFMISEIFNLQGCHILKKTNTGVTDALLVDMLVKGGDTFKMKDTTDMRHFQNLQQLTEVVAILHAIWKFYDFPLAERRADYLRRKLEEKEGPDDDDDDEDDGKEAKGGGGPRRKRKCVVPTDEMINRARCQIIDIEPLLKTELEHAVFILSLLSDKFDSKDSYSTLQALNSIIDQNKATATVVTIGNGAVLTGNGPFMDERARAQPPAPPPSGPPPPKKKKKGVAAVERHPVYANQGRLDAHLRADVPRAFAPASVEEVEEAWNNDDGSPAGVAVAESKTEAKGKSPSTVSPHYRSIPVSGPVSSRGNTTESDVLGRLAQLVRNNTAMKPTEASIMSVLREWTTRFVKGEHDKTSVHALVVDPIHGQVLIHDSLLDNNAKNKVKSTIRWLLGHAHIRRGTWLLGLSNDAHSYAWQVIHSTDKPGGPPPAKFPMKNPYYAVNTEVMRVLQEYANHGMTDLDAIESDHKFLQGVSERIPSYTTDEPFDTYTTMLRLEEIHSSPTTLLALGWCDTARETDALLTSDGYEARYALTPCANAHYPDAIINARLAQKARDADPVHMRSETRSLAARIASMRIMRRYEDLPPSDSKRAAPALPPPVVVPLSLEDNSGGDSERKRHAERRRHVAAARIEEQRIVAAEQRKQAEDELNALKQRNEHRKRLMGDMYETDPPPADDDEPKQKKARKKKKTGGDRWVEDEAEQSEHEEDGHADDDVAALERDEREVGAGFVVGESDPIERENDATGKELDGLMLYHSVNNARDTDEGFGRGGFAISKSTLALAQKEHEEEEAAAATTRKKKKRVLKRPDPAPEEEDEGKSAAVDTLVTGLQSDF